MASAFDESEIRSPTRLSALGRAALLDTDPEPYFDRITRLAARLLNSKTTLLSLVDSDRQFFKSQCGLVEPYATSRGVFEAAAYRCRRAHGSDAGG